MEIATSFARAELLAMTYSKMDSCLRRNDKKGKTPRAGRWEQLKIKNAKLKRKHQMVRQAHHR
jgi:hypothetical protein